jgi:hypothetical protein
MMDSRAASELSPRQQQLAAASASAMIADRAARAVRRSEPAAGDRYVLPATADFPVEWVLLERHRQLPAFLAVLADTHPLVGSADFAGFGAGFDAGADAIRAAGALRLRGGATAWIEESALDPSLRVGALDQVTVERARRKLLESRPDPDPEWLSEADASLEYRDWRREVVAPALAALGPQERFTAPLAPPVMIPVERPRNASRLWAAAAAVFLALNLGLASYAGLQRERVVDLAAANREMRQEMAAAVEGALQGERARQSQAASRTGQELRRLEKLRLAEAAKREELELRLADLRQDPPALAQALLNVPLASLNPAELLRGADSEVVRLTAGMPYLQVVLNLDAVEEYPSYRTVLKRQGTSSPLWQTDQLVPQEQRLSVSLPSGLFSSPGAYRFEVYGLRGKQAEPLGEYDLVIAR